MDAYDHVQRGGLKLKKGSSVSGVISSESKKKKKKDKEKTKLKELVASTLKDEIDEVKSSRSTRTKAELAFERSKRKKGDELILERASKTHKDRIMEFNEKLDNLTEHFDIPKVSWTK